MEQRRNWIGLGVIGIGLLLLGFMLGSRSAGPAWQASAPPAPVYQQAPGDRHAPGWREERSERRFEARGGLLPRGYERADGPRHGGFGMMFFAPFFFLGGLLKLALLTLLVLAALRFFRRGDQRPWGGPPWSRGEHREHREPDRPRDEGAQDRSGPEDPTSYTGGTTRL